MNRKFMIIQEGSLYEGKASTPEVFKIDGKAIARTIKLSTTFHGTLQLYKRFSMSPLKQENTQKTGAQANLH